MMYLDSSDAKKSTALLTSSVSTHGTGMGLRVPNAAAASSSVGFSMWGMNSEYAVLCRGVVRERRQGLDALLGAVDHDRAASAAGDEVWDHCLRGVPGAFEVNVDHRIPLLLGQRPREPEGDHSGVHDDNLDLAELRDTVIEGPLYRFEVPHIGDESD